MGSQGYRCKEMISSWETEVGQYGRFYKYHILLWPSFCIDKIWDDK